MSRHYYQRQSLAGLNIDQFGTGDLQKLVTRLLEDKIHGICFSPYAEGQGPGTQITAAQVEQRLALIQSNVRWIRTFSCTEGNELIPAIARQQGLKTLVGVWLDDDKENNQKEIDNAIKLANQGHADLLAVGNEVLLRGEITEQELIDYIQQVKQAVPNVPVGYVDAYYEFVDHPAVSDACDVIFANCYPFWEGYPAEHALVYMKEMFRQASIAAKGKKVIVSETGWPNLGTPEGHAVPSYDNAIRYFVNAYQWAEQEDIEMFYFSSFDEAWKVDAEGDVGAFWGIWDKDGKLKYG